MIVMTLPPDPDPYDYISTACRTGDHGTCQRRRIILCACPCHRSTPMEASHPQPGTNTTVGSLLC